MKKTLLLSALLATGTSFASQTGYLFFQSDSTANLAKNKDNSYTLTLDNVPDYVSYFSNRPQRITGIMSLTDFLKLWSDKSMKDSFLAVPPNVAFAMMPASGNALNFVATVSEPHYQDHQLQYKLTPIGKAKIETGSMAHVDIFFDDIPWNSGGFGG